MWRDNRTPIEMQKPTTEILEKISFSMHPGLRASSMNDWSTQLYSNSAEEGALLEIPCLELPPTRARPPWQQPSENLGFLYSFSSQYSRLTSEMLPPWESKLNSYKPKMDRTPTYHLNWGLISANLFVIKYITFQNPFVALHSREEIYLFFKMRREDLYHHWIQYYIYCTL